MEIWKWKKFKKSGAFRRKVKQTYEQFWKTNGHIVPNKEPVPQQDLSQNTETLHTRSKTRYLEENNDICKEEIDPTKNQWCTELEQYSESDGGDHNTMEYIDIEKNVETNKQITFFKYCLF